MDGGRASGWVEGARRGKGNAQRSEVEALRRELTSSVYNPPGGS